MNGFKIAALAILGLSALLGVAQVGKPRKPITPGEAVLQLALGGLLAWLVVSA